MTGFVGEGWLIDTSCAFPHSTTSCIDTNVFSSIIEGADPTEGGEIPTKRTKPSRKSHAEVARAVTERERRRANMKKLIRRVVATRMCVTQTEAGVIGADVASE